MLSFGKILLIAVVVLAVLAFLRGQRAQRDRAAARRKPAPLQSTETLERCPVCGVFRAPGDSFACAREDCPTRRKP